MKLAVFGVQVAALLIDFLIADCADYAGNFGIVKWAILRVVSWT